MKNIVQYWFIATLLMENALGSNHAITSTPMAQSSTTQNTQYDAGNNSINSSEQPVTYKITLTLPTNLPTDSAKVIQTTKVESQTSSSEISNNLHTSTTSVVEVTTEPPQSSSTGNEGTSTHETSTKIDTLDNTSSSITTPNGQIVNESSPGIFESATSKPISVSGSTLLEQAMVTSTPKPPPVSTTIPVVSTASEIYQESVTNPTSRTFVSTESLVEKATTEFNPSSLNSITVTPGINLDTTPSPNGQSESTYAQLGISTLVTSGTLATNPSTENVVVHNPEVTTTFAGTRIEIQSDTTAIATTEPSVSEYPVNTSEKSTKASTVNVPSTSVSTNQGEALTGESKLTISTQNAQVTTAYSEKPIEKVTTELSASSVNSRTFDTTLATNIDTTYLAETKMRSTNAVSTSEVYTSPPAVSKFITTEHVAATSVSSSQGNRLASESKLKTSTQNSQITTAYTEKPKENVTTELNASNLKSTTLRTTLGTQTVTPSPQGGSNNTFFNDPYFTWFLTNMFGYQMN